MANKQVRIWKIIFLTYLNVRVISSDRFIRSVSTAAITNFVCRYSLYTRWSWCACGNDKRDALDSECSTVDIAGIRQKLQSMLFVFWPTLQPTAAFRPNRKFGEWWL